VSGATRTASTGAIYAAPVGQSQRLVRFDSKVVVDRNAQFLLTAEVDCCLYRSVSEQELNLIQFAAGEMA